MAEPGATHHDALGRIAICAATFRRPDGLTRLLDGLKQLRFGDAPPELNIIIVDNDPEGSARSIVLGAQADSPWPIRYVHEPTQGTPHARNAALDAVGDDAQWICFIDDDESPDPKWLQELITVQQLCDADVVTGPVLPVFEQPEPAWARRGGFFMRGRHETGTRLTHAFTNNVMFRAQLVRDMNLRFETQYRHGVGEDRALFRRLAVAGATIVWADRAIVTEWIPPHRVDAGWLIRRMYYIGRSTTQMERDIVGGAGVLFTQLAKGIVWIGIGVMTLPASLIGRHMYVRARRWINYGAGLIAGLRASG